MPPLCGERRRCGRRFAGKLSENLQPAVSIQLPRTGIFPGLGLTHCGERIHQLLRRQRNFQTLYSDKDVYDAPADEPPEGADDIPPQVLQDMICALPTGYRTVFNLYVFENKSHREIASLLNIAESTSASQLHRAKQMLARQIKAYMKK